MLNPNRPIDLKLLIGFLVFLKPKPITLKGWGRGRGGFLVGPSLPNHDAKDWKGKIKIETKERKQRKPRENCIREG